MKTFLVPTDFSPEADNAARFAVYLAKDLKADVQLCHALSLPEESPVSAQVVWPLEDYNYLKKDADQNLLALSKQFAEEEASVSDHDSHHPLITTISQVGTVTDVVRNLVCYPGVSLVVMGMSGAGRLKRFFLGSSSRDVIEKGGFPTLLIPSHTVFHGFKKVAFATDLGADDVLAIAQLAAVIKPFNADLMVIHIKPEGVEQPEDAARANAFMSEVTQTVNYPAIGYRSLRAVNIDAALNSLCESDELDLLAVVHRKHSIYTWLTSGSHTQKLARHTQIPLLVYPG
ncbi:universal stress protein [Mucilaginibacter sp. RS28]|uniref:Universal stress protein n=1 Tax=Mucilaginibacter straminoryzae TaxID=2932774 RepID=A0A9X2B7H7_9SPHI|nr:universal stress protein [Mucilaginibacter straminoryzae]MCJ8208336.1 universal stress protein [Mucilaginibacter straminoryzae]